MQSQKSKKFLLISLMAASSIYAKPEVGLNEILLEPTVVTATGFERILKDETRNMHVVSRADIKNHGYKTLKEALEKIPSVDFVSSSVGSTIDMRGQGNRGSGASPTMAVKVMLNGVPMNMTDSAHGIVAYDMIAIEDVERIEAMPGGGAVLYGSGTRGGVINIITKQKPQDFYTNLSTKFGSYSYRDLGMGVGSKINDDLFAKFSAKTFAQKGYTKDEKERGYYLSSGINYQISDKQSLSLTPSIYKSKINTADSLTSEQVSKNRRQNPNNGKTTLTKNTKIDISANYEAQYSDFYTINLMPYYQRIKLQNSQNIDYVSEGLFGDKKYGVNFKNKLSYTNGEVIFGYDFTKNIGERESHINTTQKITAGPMVATLNVKTDTVLDLRKSTHAGYVLTKHDFDEIFDLSLGYRFESSKYDLSRIADTKVARNGVLMPARSSHHEIKSKKTANNHAFEITPNFSYSESGNIYFKFERGYISPSPAQLTDKDRATGKYNLNDLKSEKFNTYEIGIKDRVFDAPIQATLFLTDTKDEIAQDMYGSHAAGWRYYNLAKTRRYGGELSSKQYLFDSLFLTQSYSYVNAKIKQGTNAGKEVPYVSNHKFMLGVDYEAIKNLHIFSDVKFYSSKKDSNYDKIKTKSIVDAGVNYTFAENFTLGAGVKNLFNKKYYDYESKKSDLYKPANERNFYVEFKYSY